MRQIDGEIGDRIVAAGGDGVDRDRFATTCLAYLEIALDPEVRRIVLQDGPSVLGQRLQDIDREGSVEPLREAVQALQDRGDFIPGDATALAVLINGAMIDAALWVASGDDTDERHAAASQALKSVLLAVSRSA